MSFLFCLNRVKRETRKIIKGFEVVYTVMKVTFLLLFVMRTVSIPTFGATVLNYIDLK